MTTQAAPVRLRCEYLSDPLGIDVLRPRLSWWPGDERPAELQTAYRLLAASHPDLLAMDEGDLWDSGLVEGRETAQIEYQGKPLVSGRRVWWKVRSFDSDGLPSPWSEVAVFEAGLLEAADWAGRWISAGLVGSRTSGVPVPLFCRSFELPAAATQARLYLAARGFVAARLNDRPLTAGMLAPGWVDFARRAEYLTLDVTGLLREGGNGIAVLLADGWYAGDPGTGYRQQYGDRPELLVQLNVTLADGSAYSLASDGDWRWRPSWILAADPTRGEQLDALRRPDSWLGEGPEPVDWYPVRQGARAEETAAVMSAATLPSTDDDKLIHAKLVRWQGGECRALFELPEPVLGRARVTITAPDGGAVRIRYGLALDERDELAACGEDVCVAAGAEAGETLEGQFALHGFRYVEISGDVYRDDGLGVAAVGLGHDQPAAAELIADHPRLNQLFDLLIGHLRRTQRVADIAGLRPDDRMGEVASVGAAMNARLLTLDGLPLVSRWLRQMRDAQFPEGAFPAVVPVPPAEEALASEGPAGASVTYVETLWQLYRMTGDRRLLREHFPAVRQLLAGSLAASREFIREDLDSDPAYPADLAATAWSYRAARLAARLAGVLGLLSDLEDAEELAVSIRNAFRRRFVTPDGRVVGDSAPVYALTLGLGLLDRPEQHRARPLLVRAVEAGLNTGGTAVQSLLATPWLLPVLTEQGRLDLAYRLVLEADVAVDFRQGGRDLGALVRAGVLEWLFGTLSGFAPGRDLSEDRVAFRRALIQPRPPIGLAVNDGAGEPPIRAVETALATQSGRYESSWQITEDAFELRVRVPGNCAADVVLPDGTRHAVDAGRHEFRMPFGEAGDGIPILREVS